MVASVETLGFGIGHGTKIGISEFSTVYRDRFSYGTCCMFCMTFLHLLKSAVRSALNCRKSSMNSCVAFPMWNWQTQSVTSFSHMLRARAPAWPKKSLRSLGKIWAHTFFLEINVSLGCFVNGVGWIRAKLRRWWSSTTHASSRLWWVKSFPSNPSKSED